MEQAFHTIDHLPDRFITLDGQPYLFFSGTAYLGLPQHPSFRQLMTEAMARYGTVFGSSRNGNLRLAIYEPAEAQLAAFAGAPAALTLSSGMMAGQAVINWLKLPSAWAGVNSPVTFIYAPHTHPALWHEPTVSLPGCPFSDWVAGLPALLAQGDGPVVILVNSLDAVRSEAYFFDWMASLPTNRPITVVVDDSHGLGVLGHERRGIWQHLPKPAGVRVVVTASLAKAMGLPGGVVLAGAEPVASLRHTAFFGGCSPIPPAYLNAYVEAGTLYQQAHDKLGRLIQLAETWLLPTGLFKQAPDYPVFYTDDDALYPFLLKQGICIYSFAYPTAADKANTRIVISAFHEPEDIDRLGEAVRRYRAELPTEQVISEIVADRS
ncbi:aminotransferase class I/II-fold pyridoxal phosphate-dependent enzyme [Arsenicibacter rosenii]|uniref:Aminotransferase class I/II n=1 Tax=Arsenicibacter rosenii TaxID=1750698 RepID=A0A1S2VPE8_9BACT|nr:aminotransferase class I/II-fold pyridoxal phosphate-dependent enzyme [Arsenicibacter rosenii]OIN60125.1 aminotransferase class I/II [Arsenicibacter rosenii]